MELYFVVYLNQCSCARFPSSHCFFPFSVHAYLLYGIWIGKDWALGKKGGEDLEERERQHKKREEKTGQDVHFLLGGRGFDIALPPPPACASSIFSLVWVYVFLVCASYTSSIMWICVLLVYASYTLFTCLSFLSPHVQGSQGSWPLSLATTKIQKNVKFSLFDSFHFIDKWVFIYV